MYKLEITDDMSDLEKFVRQEADLYVKETMFSSCISLENPHIVSVVKKGKDVTSYVVKLYKENGEYSHQNMFTHFFLLVMQNLYGNPFEGYVGMDFAVRYWLKAYEHDCLDWDKEKDNTAFLFDLFDCKSIDELKEVFKPQVGAYDKPEDKEGSED